MPRFYFHLRGGPEGLSRDGTGLDLPDVETAYLEAYDAVIDTGRELIIEGLNPQGYAFEITNRSGELMVEIPFAEVLDRHAEPRPPLLVRETLREPRPSPPAEPQAGDGSEPRRGSPSVREGTPGPVARPAGLEVCSRETRQCVDHLERTTQGLWQQLEKSHEAIRRSRQLLANPHYRYRPWTSLIGQ
ncbi:hypothetical protein KBI52_04600 [Microvirga sp. HBU67558]|uniref:DUF6894 family protein n=1 Tax=Microvirga TaxID=186650 RepID=UPI001B38EE4D|nr:MULTISPECIES: hypothetical protein [unclassified Microvirga]MBQ0819502.1 hypothetical protein [Microvirga sp. HBU67558]